VDGEIFGEGDARIDLITWSICNTPMRALIGTLGAQGSSACFSVSPGMGHGALLLPTCLAYFGHDEIANALMH
jgi:hypothetical protein